jgi:hypothetical protein
MNKEDIQKFIKEKRIVENAKKYWWAILIGVLLLLYIIKFSVGGPADVSQDGKISSSDLEELTVTYITHPNGNEVEYPAKYLMSYIQPAQTAPFVDSLSLEQNPKADMDEMVKMIRFSEKNQCYR